MQVFLIMECTYIYRKLALPFALNDASVAVPAHGHDGHGRHEQGQDFPGREASTEQRRVGPERPLLEQQLPERDGHREEAEEEVGEGQGHDEVVVRRPHRRLAENRDLEREPQQMWSIFFGCYIPKYVHLILFINIVVIARWRG